MDEDLKMVRREYLRTVWIEEAMQIPLYDVEDKHERELLIKCIQEDDFTEEEIDDLEQVLGRYREAIEKHEPQQAIENLEHNTQLVQDEKSILSLMREAREEQTLTMRYPLSDNETIDIKLLVKNEIDAEALDDLQQNLELFADLTQEELETYQKYTHDEQMTREERAIAEHIEEKLREKSAKNITQMRTVAIKFLAKQTRLYDDPDSSEEGMYEIYSEMKLGYLLALFEKVQSMTGVSNIETDNLFR